MTICGFLKSSLTANFIYFFPRNSKLSLHPCSAMEAKVVSLEPSFIAVQRGYREEQECEEKTKKPKNTTNKYLAICTCPSKRRIGALPYVACFETTDGNQGFIN